MDTTERIKELALLAAFSADLMAPSIDAAADLVRECLNDGGKVLICGNGGSAAHAQHLAAELVGRFQSERDGYSAISLSADASVLTAIANDFGFENVFSRQVEALGQPGDILVAISTSGRSENIIKAMRAADRRSMPVVLLTGELYAGTRGPDDVVIIVPSADTAMIQEMHQVVIHCLCARIEGE